VKIIRLHGYIGKEAFWGDEITLQYVQQLVEGVEGDEIKIEINSGGGDVNEGFAIADYLRGSGKVIHTEVLGLCGSIATVIALVAPVERRTMHANSDYFVHNPYWIPNMDAMEAKEVQAILDSLQDAQERILDYYVKHTGSDREALRSYMDAQSTLTADKAQDLGFIGSIIGEKVENKQAATIFAYVSPEKKQKTNFQIMNPILAEVKKLAALIKGEKTEPEIEAAATLGAWIQEKGEDVVAQLVEQMGQERYDLVVGEDCPTEAEVSIIAEVSGASVEEVKELAMADGCKFEPVEDLAAENETLKAEITSLNSQIEELTNSLQAEKSTNEEIKAEIDEIKNMVMGSEPPKPLPEKQTSAKFDGIRNNLTKAKQNRA